MGKSHQSVYLLSGVVWHGGKCSYGILGYSAATGIRYGSSSIGMLME